MDCKQHGQNHAAPSKPIAVAIVKSRRVPCARRNFHRHRADAINAAGFVLENFPHAAAGINPTGHAVVGAADEGQAVFDRAKSGREKRVVQTGHSSRSAAYVASAKKYIADGKLGAIHFCRVVDQKGQSNFPAKPDGKEDLGNGVKLGTSPSGKAIKFQHRGAYDDIESTYDVITAYLDAKGLQVDSPYIEEYLTELKTADDPNLQVDIYVFMK